jgi:phage repressor protein C with HTH and peptisase S24 domain
LILLEIKLVYKENIHTFGLIKLIIMVSERLGQYLDKKGISFYAFENNLEAGRGSISKAVKEGKSIGSTMLENILRKYTDLNPTWLLTGEGQMLLTDDEPVANATMDTYRLKTDHDVESQQIPLYDIEAVAGLVPLFKDSKAQEPLDHISIPHLPKCDGAVYVTGDSMYPLLKSGDIVLYKQVNDVQNEIFWGEMYLLSIDMGGEEYVTVKYIQKSEQNGYVRLVSQNKHHQDKDVQMSKIRALALVKASIRINSMN